MHILTSSLTCIHAHITHTRICTRTHTHAYTQTHILTSVIGYIYILYYVHTRDGDDATTKFAIRCAPLIIRLVTECAR